MATVLVQEAVSVFLIMVGLGQLISTQWKLYGASLVGASRWVGYGVGAGLLLSGALILPITPYVFLWTPLMGPLTVLVLLVGGSYIAPLSHPNSLFTPEHAAHGGCRPVQIPDGDDTMPGLLLTPKAGSVSGAAVCLIPGAGDTKVSFKWRLVQALLAEGLTVLTIDPPGHGDYRHRPMAYPDCLATVAAAVQFLQAQPGMTRVGLLGISLGGALAINTLAQQVKAGENSVEALAVIATPIRLNYSQAMLYREMWRTFYGSPVLSLLRETTAKQIRQSWYSGGYRSRHSTGELFDLLNPPENISTLKNIPILLVYSRRDLVAPPTHAQAMRQAARHAQFIESKKASHVMLTLIPEVNRQVAGWFREQLSK